jgi:hypothetical protein
MAALRQWAEWEAVVSSVAGKRAPPTRCVAVRRNAVTASVRKAGRLAAQNAPAVVGRVEPPVVVVAERRAELEEVAVAPALAELPTELPVATTPAAISRTILKIAVSAARCVQARRRSVGADSAWRLRARQRCPKARSQSAQSIACVAEACVVPEGRSAVRRPGVSKA